MLPRFTFRFKETRSSVVNGLYTGGGYLYDQRGVMIGGITEIYKPGGLSSSFVVTDNSGNHVEIGGGDAR